MSHIRQFGSAEPLFVPVLNPLCDEGTESFPTDRKRFHPLNVLRPGTLVGIQIQRVIRKSHCNGCRPEFVGDNRRIPAAICISLHPDSLGADRSDPNDCQAATADSGKWARSPSAARSIYFSALLGAA